MGYIQFAPRVNGMNAKENFLTSIFFEDPEYVPRGNEEVIKIIEIEGEISWGKNWIDEWGFIG